MTAPWMGARGANDDVAGATIVAADTGGSQHTGGASGRPLVVLADLAQQPPEAPRIGDMLTDWETPLRTSTSRYPAIAADGGTHGPLEVLAAATAGLSHLQDAMGCQDAFALQPTIRGVMVSIADGVSNAALGAVGAAESSRAAVVTGGHPERPPAEALGIALWAAHEALSKEAHVRGADPHDLATTLIVAAVEPSGQGMHVDLIAVGDSSAFVMRSPSDMTRLAGPTELASSVLKTSLPLREEMHHEKAQATLGPDELLLLVTDGLAADLINSPAVRDWCWERWTTAQSPLQAAAALGYRRQGTSDDLAAVVVRRRR